MLHQPVHQQLAHLGSRGAAALAHLPLNDEVLDALAVLLLAECLHRDSPGQALRCKLAKRSQSVHPADVDLRRARPAGSSCVASTGARSTGGGCWSDRAASAVAI